MLITTCVALNPYLFVFFFFNDTATTEIYTLSLHDALPILSGARSAPFGQQMVPRSGSTRTSAKRSEEHTSELQSQSNLVCRLLLEKKNIRRADWELITRFDTFSLTYLMAHSFFINSRSVWR